MHKSTLLIIALTIGLQGCSVLSTRTQDIPHRPIMEEQDTPFVFKQAYQTEGLYATQVMVETQSDFVDIESSVQYVWWTPSASLDVFASIEEEEVLIEPPTEPPAEEHGDKEIAGPSPEESPMEHVTPVGSTRPEYECAMIHCDGFDEACGAIQVCDGQICDEAKRSEYECLNEACTQVQANTIIEVAKGEIKCPEFPERYMCPQSTECKLAPHQTDGTVSIEAAQQLFMEGEEDE